MKRHYPLKIDAYSHISPPKYKAVLEKIAPQEVAYKLDPFLPSLT